MKVLAFVDLHGSKSGLRKIISRARKKDVELIVCAGDFTIFGEAQEEILSRLDKLGKPVLVIHGNHEDDVELRKDCKKFKNCYFIHNNKFRKNSYLFLGWGGGGFSFRDNDFEKRAKKFKEWVKQGDKVVFVSHAPPYKTRIDEIGGEHAGNKSFRKFIEKIKPELVIAGHLHECVGEDKIGKTKVMNPGYKGRIIVV
ncbi:metallophosphoesterase [Candidatus Woesearchaeota archaeon]|nr:metallophosphoesterase [Candidatus Woesearchaeota archaeon]